MIEGNADTETQTHLDSIHVHARRLCSQFKKLVPFAMDKRRGSGPRE